ncbi:hypothetical protein QWY75_04715 [Pontixanthobacter aestiaquae]|uniref:Uncharacterized protein n=1 Tax=Pontixanthobacter aestiaquae TaxID=1509367 RepID=A0A844Z482_9SPHN|nr:hypothetical protein [Pontixanthobacter aestiaquae]MDN3645511.1 hypothetical protein [Pontixanthobacter aestiaquae]MXO83491.1 hypothetical protein [Pontixanthobacter aestiaquae]
MAFQFMATLALALSLQQAGGADVDTATTTGQPDTSAEVTETTEVKSEVETEDMNKVKCRYIYQLNSRVPDRICRTKARWAEIEKEQQEAIENGRRNGGNASETGTIYGADPNG